MKGRMVERIPLSLITGFLGSGKTTLLTRLIERQASRRIVYVVNEFGSIDVDGRTLNLRDNEWVSIPGGSIFCTCLTGEFMRRLRAIPEAFGDEGGAVEGVLVEASGIADPRVVGRMLAETRLDALYELRRVISVVDPGTFGKLLQTLPSMAGQIEACDLGLINKTDLYDEARLEAVEREVHRINPEARLVRTSYCDAGIDPWAEAKRRPVRGEYAPCADPDYQRLTLRIERPVEVETLRGELKALQPEVYRIKGRVLGMDGAYAVDVAEGGVTVEGAPDGRMKALGDSRLVCIFPPASLAAVEAFGIRITTGKQARSGIL